MTEKQAWLHLAKLWDHPTKDGTRVYVEMLEGFGFEPCGLCDCIEELGNRDDISWEVNGVMLGKIPERLPNGFVWPTNLRGAKQRAEFCRKQAAACRKREVKS